MSRRRDVPKRSITPDSRYGDRLVAKFINVLMRDGKKSLAEGIMYNAFSLVEKRVQEEPLRVFRRALDNVRPRVEVKSRRVGGATYQVPVEVDAARGTALAMRWLTQFARARSGSGGMTEKLAAELLDAASERGEAVRKREDTHRMADANKAFAHYRW